MRKDRRCKRADAHRILILRTLNARSTKGLLQLGSLSWPCAIGRSGRHPVKREGDGRTPAGQWPLRRVYYRADRGQPPLAGLLAQVIRKADGWCDAVSDRNYNRYVRHPYAASAEHLWRADELYDVVVVLGHNDRPRIKGNGSAIFMHLARAGFKPTAGCIALSKRDLRQVLARCARGATLIVPA